MVKENVGFAEGCNIGFRESNAEIIALLKNDMEVDKNWLINAVEILQSNKKVGSVHSKIMQYHDRAKIWCAGLSIDSLGLAIQIGRGEIDHGQYDNLSEIWPSEGEQ